METKQQDNFWIKVLPACAEGFGWGGDLCKKTGNGEFKTGLCEVFQKMDDSEFNMFLAKVVIKASGSGIVGVDLTERIGELKDLRTA